MQRELRDYIVFKNNEAYKQLSLPTGKGKDYCNKLSKAYPDNDWSIERRFYPCETD